MSFHELESARLTHHPILKSSPADGNNGMFILESVEPGWQLAVLASDSSEPAGEGLPRWEHASVHAFKGEKQRTPKWLEMCYVKNLFWDSEDVVMQLHPRASQYVNCHPHTLHLWRPIDAVIPEPPAIFVGPR